MNDDIYQRKDLADEKYSHLFDMINDLHRRIDDQHSTMNHLISAFGIGIAILSIVVPIVLHYLPQLPH